MRRNLAQRLMAVFAAVATAFVLAEPIQAVLPQKAVTMTPIAPPSDFQKPGQCLPTGIVDKALRDGHWQAVATGQSSGPAFFLFADEKGDHWRLLRQADPAGTALCLADEGKDMHTAMPGGRRYNISMDSAEAQAAFEAFIAGQPPEQQMHGAPPPGMQGPGCVADVKQTMNDLNWQREETTVFTGTVEDGGKIVLMASGKGERAWTLMLVKKDGSACILTQGGNFSFADTFKPPALI